MNGIVGMANVALDAEPGPDQREAITTVQTCARSLVSILNDILDYSKIEAGKLEIASGPFRPGHLVHSACSIFVPIAAEKSVRLLWDASLAEGWFRGDAGRLRQVLTNLINNALKFTRKGEISVLAEVHDDRLCFTVRDTGVGIPENVLPMIFDAFRQADATTSLQYGGTGLGLAISARVGELLGGQIGVEREVGAGSVFHFWIPAVAAESPALPSPPARREPWAERESAPLRILLAEDNRVNQQVAVSLLERRGHRVEVVENGRRVVERWAAGEFDVILMDLQMPEMDGWEATRLIRDRERGQGSRIPIVALTAHAMAHVRERCLEVGMDAVVVKPFDPAALYRELEGLATLRRNRAGSA